MGKNGILKNKAGEQIFPATTADQVAWDKTTNLKQAMAKQDARISNLAKLPSGSTTGDAELQDIRTGEDGTVYDNAGEAVRGQIGQLKESLNSVASFVVSKNLFDPQYAHKNQRADTYAYNQKIAPIVDNNENYNYVVIPVKPSTTYTVSRTEMVNVTVIGTDNNDIMIINHNMLAYPNKRMTFTTKSETKIYITYGKNCTDTLQIEEGENATDYEEYFEPYYKIAETVENNIGEKINSKNLFNKEKMIKNQRADSYTYNQKIAPIVDNNENYNYVVIPVKPSTTYTVSRTEMVNVTIVETDINNIMKIKRDTLAYPNKKMTFTTRNDTNLLFVTIDKECVNSLQIEEGENATDYEEYFEPYELVKDYYQIPLAKENRKRIEKLENEEDIHATHYTDEEDQLISKVQQEISDSTIVFSLFTDVHASDVLNEYEEENPNNNKGYKNYRNFAKIVRKISEKIGVDFIVNLGDTINSTSDESTDNHTDHTENKKRLAEFTMNIQKTNIPYVYAAAHHELYPWGDENALTKNEILGLENRYSRYLKFVKNDNDVNKGYYYFDIDDKKTRIIVLDSCCNSSADYSDLEINWVKNRALETEYKIIVFSHMGTNETNSGDNPNNGNELETILNNSGKIIAYYHGHTHWDNIIMPEESGINFPFISTEKAWCTTYVNFWRDNILGSPSSYKRRYDTYLEYAFDVNVVNVYTGKIKIFRFGAGSDRFIIT